MKPVSVQHRFEAIVSENSEQIAIVENGKSITYAKLNDRANRVASNLKIIGVGPGANTIVAMQRSANFIVTILALVKLGATYIPVRYDVDAKEHQLLASQAQALCIIVDSFNVAVGEGEIAVTNFDDLEKSNDRQTISLPTKRTKDDCLYIMFTSGSTGAPKGVMIPDRAVLRLVIDTNFTNITRDDTIFLTADTSFDASTFEIWGALLNGARLIVEGGEFDYNVLGQAITKYSVTIVWLTAGLFHIIGKNKPEIFRPLRQLLAGGDVLSSAVIRSVLQACPTLEIINGYGPTENTTFTCCYSMTLKNLPGNNVPIGIPISGTNVHLLDKNLKRIAVGEIGTIYTSGDGVALGYLNKPDDPSFFYQAEIAEGKIYNTGDQAFLKDGVFRFCGRQDSLVKIRGYRVSTSFVKEQVYRLKYVEEVVLYVKSNAVLGNSISILLKVSNADKSIVQIKQDLAEFLPEYMIPDRISIVEKIELNKNGKVASPGHDRDRLKKSAA